MSRQADLFDRAADCQRRFEQASNPEEKGTFKVLRDMWAALANEFKRIKLSISAGLREAGVCQSIGADLPFLLAQPHVDRCVAQRPLALVWLVPQSCRPKTQIMFATQR